MATHNVYVTLPYAELGKKDAYFEIYENNKKLGRITISKGHFEYFPKNSKKPYRLKWSQLDNAIVNYFEK